MDAPHPEIQNVTRRTGTGSAATAVRGAGTGNVAAAAGTGGTGTSAVSHGTADGAGMEPPPQNLPSLNKQPPPPR